MSAIDRFDCIFFLNRNGLSDGKFVSFTNNDNGAFPANIRLDVDVLKTSSVFVFRRRLHQDQFICLTHISSRCLDQDQYIRLGYMSSRHLQDVFKTSSRRLAKTSSGSLQDIFKTSC